MREHIIPSIVASVVAVTAIIGYDQVVKHKPVRGAVLSVGDRMAEAGKEEHQRVHGSGAQRGGAGLCPWPSCLAKTTWPEMDQANIDKLTAAVKDLPGEHRVTIFCIEESKCGDLSLNLHNAFESAHWQSDVRDLSLNLANAFESAHWQSDVQDYPMIWPGISSSSQPLVDALNASGLTVRFDLNVPTIHGAAIAIGTRYTP